MNFIASNLKFLRESKKLSQSDMQDSIGFAQTTWNNYEKEVSKPKLNDLIIISNYFDTTVDEILKTDLSKGKVIGNESDAKNRQKGKLKGKPLGKVTHQYQQKEAEASQLNDPGSSYGKGCSECASKDLTIKSLQDHIETLKSTIALQSTRLQELSQAQKKG